MHVRVECLHHDAVRKISNIWQLLHTWCIQSYKIDVVIGSDNIS